LEEDKGMDNMTQQEYMNMYKHPLTDESMDAIMTLSQVAEDQKKKKRDKKKKKEVEARKKMRCRPRSHAILAL
jgi:hypothetical protein